MTEFQFEKFRDDFIDESVKKTEAGFLKRKTGDALVEGYELSRKIEAMDDFDVIFALRRGELKSMRRDKTTTKEEIIFFQRVSAQIEIVHKYLKYSQNPVRPDNQKGSPSEGPRR